MNKYKTLYIILGIIIFLVIIASLGRFTNRPDNQESEKIDASGAVINPTLFYGNTCPHCENVDTFVNANNVKNKVQFEELEVYDNKDNAAKLVATAQKCGLAAGGGVGVPFFYDGQNCIVGDQPIIDYFQTKLK